MSKQTAVEWYEKEKTALLIKLENQKITLGEFAVKNVDLFQRAKQMERENASTFGIRVTSECCSLKNGKMEVDLHKFETLLNEMYGE